MAESVNEEIVKSGSPANAEASRSKVAAKNVEKHPQRANTYDQEPGSDEVSFLNLFMKWNFTILL